VSIRDQYSTENPNTTNRVMLKSATSRATVQSAFVSGSSHDAQGASVIYTDDTSDTSDLDASDLGNYGQDDVEGLGWQGENKIMLQMAAGNNIGDATKFYATQNFVNL